MRVLQLFNASGGKKGQSTGSEDGPNHLKGERVLSERGIEVMTLGANAFPVNPLGRMHNAYAGLDPLRSIYVLLCRRNVDIIVGHMESVFFILLLRKLFRFKPKIIIWEVPWSVGWKYREMISNIAIPRCDACVVFSTSQTDLVKTEFGPRTPCQFIPFCVDTEFFDGSHRAMPANYILSTGRDVGRDFQILADVANDVGVEIKLRTNNPVHVPPDAVEYLTLMKDRLSFQDYRALYESASIVVVAAHETPNASGVTSLLEAMSMAKPVIVTATRALNDYLPPEDAGIVIAVGDKEALKRAIRYLLDNPSVAKAMGERGRQFVLEKFSPSAHFNAMADMFLEDSGKAVERPS